MSEFDPSQANLRAGDADRRALIDVLATAYADGRLTQDEFDERSSRALAAKTFGDLNGLTDDLLPESVARPLSGVAVSPTSSAPVASSVPGASSVPVMPGAGPSSQNIVAVMSGSERTGRWTVPETLNCYSVMGGTHLDFTDAVLTSQRTVINVGCLMGGIDIVVPAGIEVINEATGFMGGISVRGIEHSDGPVLVLRGVAIMGGVDVKGPGVQQKSHRKLERQ